MNCSGFKGGGKGGIRTRETFYRLLPFQGSTLGHSDTFPHVKTGVIIMQTTPVLRNKFRYHHGSLCLK